MVKETQKTSPIPEKSQPPGTEMATGGLMFPPEQFIKLKEE